MASRRNRVRAFLLLFLIASAQIQADGVKLPASPLPRPQAVFSLPVSVRHRRALRFTSAVGMAAGLACAALSLARLYTDGARFVADSAPASTLRRDILIFSAGTALLSISAAAFDSLEPRASVTSGE
jgi:hypothetical protein